MFQAPLTELEMRILRELAAVDVEISSLNDGGIGHVCGYCGGTLSAPCIGKAARDRLDALEKEKRQ